jgi:hypothetical protein
MHMQAGPGGDGVSSRPARYPLAPFSRRAGEGGTDHSWRS